MNTRQWLVRELKKADNYIFTDEEERTYYKKLIRGQLNATTKTTKNTL